MEAAAVADMDFHMLSRRELQALCKRNGVRANMTNAAMAEALQALTSVDGIDEIGSTLCLPTPGRSAMKSAAKMVAVDVEEQQHGSPLPRGRRVSVKSPEAIRMEVEGGEDEVKEIVKTPGVALRSTRRGTRATPAPLPTVPAGSTRATARRSAVRKTGEVVPTPATRRSQRSASRKAAGAVEADRPAEDVSEEKVSKMTIALDQVAEVVVGASKEKVQLDELKAPFSDVRCYDPKEEKVQLEEPKAVASDVKCDDPEEEEVAKFLEGDNKEEELEEGEEADSSDAAVLVKSCTDPKVEEVVVVLEEQPTKPAEGIVKEEVPISAEKSAPLTVMEDSPILGVIEKEHDASVEDCEDLAELSPAREMTDEIIPVTEDKQVAVNEEAVKEDGFIDAVETDPTPKEILLTAAVEGETIEEDGDILTEGKEGAAGEMPLAGETVEEDEEDYLTELKEGAFDEVLQADLADNEISEEDDDLTEVGEGGAGKMLQGEVTDEESSEEDGLVDNETSEEDEDALIEVRERTAAKMLQGELADDETSEEDDIDEDEEWASDDDENTEEMGSTDETNEDIDESHSTDVVQMLQGTGIAEEANEDSSAEDDDFSGDLPPEFDNLMIFSDPETEGDITLPVLEENQAAVASATKIAKPLDDSVMNAVKEEGPKESDATEKFDNVVKSLDEFTFKEGESEEMQKQQQQPQDFNSMSLRKLKTTYKKFLISAQEGKQEEVTEGKRLPLEEVDENTCINH